MRRPARLIEWMLDDEDDEPVITERDLEWVICSRCEGNGELRGWPGAYTESDRAEWSDYDYEEYAATRRCCEDCGGSGKLRELSEEALSRPSVRAYVDDYYETEAIYRSERAMGA